MNNAGDMSPDRTRTVARYARRVAARDGGMPRRGGIEIHIRVALDVWFCDYSEWWAVW